MYMRTRIKAGLPIIKTFHPLTIYRTVLRMGLSQEFTVLYSFLYNPWKHFSEIRQRFGIQENYLFKSGCGWTCGKKSYFSKLKA